MLGWRRHGAQTDDELDRLAAAVLPLPPGRLVQLLAVRRWVEVLRPDIVHAHSSYAGLYVRLLPRRLAGAVVYTPHGFSFERRDVPAALRGCFWLAEAALSVRGACVAAVGPREADQRMVQSLARKATCVGWTPTPAGMTGCPPQLMRADSTQNSLPSGSASTTQGTPP